jgi:nucleotide-binding universal stress UspA family protein
MSDTQAPPPSAELAPGCLVVAVDGSPGSLAAVRHALAEAQARKLTPRVHLVNVQPALPGDVTRFVDKKTVQDYQREAGDTALAAAIELARAAGHEPGVHVLVGESAQALTTFARQQQAAALIIGTRGWGGFMGWVMGSVASRVVQLADMPVVLVKEPAPAA